MVNFALNFREFFMYMILLPENHVYFGSLAGTKLPRGLLTTERYTSILARTTLIARPSIWRGLPG